MRALLVDDDALYLRTLQRALERRGIAIVTATDGAAALAAVREHTPDVILLDLKLAHESGLDLIAPLRAAHPPVRIVLVTGYASVATAVEAMKRGADNYIAKPASADTILRVLRGESLLDDTAAPEMTPLARVEWEHIQQAMTDTDGNVSAAARLLGMHRRTLQRKLGKRPARGVASSQD